ncbi:hypothetical protein AAG570_007321 [Ranatra chinensis]|uniref:Uncharacterized protein n=1 Tax=Ranatra chinensis TaxID=642074 RepID=A0ABD0XXF6_9HEMI
MFYENKKQETTEIVVRDTSVPGVGGRAGSSDCGGYFGAGSAGDTSDRLEVWSGQVRPGTRPSGGFRAGRWFPTPQGRLRARVNVCVFVEGGSQLAGRSGKGLGELLGTTKGIM